MHCVYQKIYPKSGITNLIPTISSTNSKSIITLIKNPSDMCQIIESLLIDIYDAKNVISDKSKIDMANLTAPLGLYLIRENDSQFVLYHKSIKPCTSYMSYFSTRYEIIPSIKWTIMPLTIPVHSEITDEGTVMTESDIQKIE